MKVLFLDIDGVLNTHDRCTFHPNKIHILGYIIACCECDIVVSSTRRLTDAGRNQISVTLNHYGISVDDYTTDLCKPSNGSVILAGVPRSDEIQAYLSMNRGIHNYVILDDDSDADVGGRLVQTNPVVGLTLEIADKVISLFNQP